MIKIKKGLDLPITGSPDQQIGDSPAVRTVAVMGLDYVGMKPTMAIQEGERVKKGQLLFSDKKTEGVLYTAPASGTVSAINRGEKRSLQSIVIDVEGSEAVEFNRYSIDQLAGLERQTIVDQLVQSGQWVAFRTRPFSKVPAPDTTPEAIFVTAMDTNPLAANPEVVIADQKEALEAGLVLIAKLSAGKTYLCYAEGATLPIPAVDNLQPETFAGLHPAGNVGTHIHFLRPASESKTVWHIGYQDVIAVGRLFLDGELYVDRVLSLAGPRIDKPRLIRARVGASTDELTAGQMESDGLHNRVISGSVFNGRTAKGPVAFLGRYHVQLTVLQENRGRELFGYMRAGVNKHSVMNIFVSKLNPTKRFSFTTTTNGSPRAIVPVGAYEMVMPLDILPTQLLRYLVVGDLEMAQALGCLELDEEDLALCTYVCAGKYEYGPILRDVLTKIEKEG